MNDKIDMVYLWCDGNEAAFQERRNSFLKAESDATKQDKEISGVKRFFDNSELKYSLRSLEQNAPWINHVYIVTDRQVPQWLNTNYEKVSIVDNLEIMPKELDPCFNSSIIEQFLPYIANLSEKFLYGNDDMFFGQAVTEEDFFYNDLAIVKASRIPERHLAKMEKEIYFSQVLRANRILNKKYDKNAFYMPHHNIDAYLKSEYLKTLDRFEDELKVCRKNKFRSSNDIQRFLFNLDMVYSGKAILELIETPKPWRRRLNFIKKVDWQSYYGEDGSPKTQKEILKYKPKLFCLNAGDDCDKAIKKQAKIFMESLFPQPSKFEI